MVLKALRYLTSVGFVPALVRLVFVSVAVALSLAGLCATIGIGIRTALANGWFGAAALFPGVACAWIYTAPALAWQRRMDGRVADMLVATLFAIWLTLVGLLLGALEAHRVIEEIFTGWIASVIFWALVGLIVAIVSVARSENEGYDTRARILFKGDTGPHIDYIVAALCGTIGHYAVRIARDITIREYHPDPGGGGGWFLLELESTMVLRAYVEDTETIYTSKAEYTNVNPTPLGGRAASIVQATCKHVDGTTSRPNIVNRSNGHTIEYTTRFNRPGNCEFTVHREYWVREGEENIYELGRFTRDIATKIRNVCPNRDPVSMERRIPAATGRIPLQRDDGWKIIALDQDRKPDEIVHDFSLYA